MKVTFFSNFLNHHQIPFCNEMYKLLGNDFKFVATEEIPEERINMGYRDCSKGYEYAISTYESLDSYNYALKLGENSDIVITGSAPEIFIKNRLEQNKLTFRYSERIFKKGIWRIIDPRVLASLYKHHTRYRSKNLYMLCASAYTAFDFALAGAYKGKAYKWGYFPEIKLADINELFLKKRNSPPKLLWAGRFIDWKHPEHAIILADMLKKQGYDFTLDMIGTGVMEGNLKTLIQKYNLEDEVKILGSMSPENVREHMEASNIFLFTSDFNEGWGAVLNESMNSGCAVVASHAIGSVPYLIKNEDNGLVYKNGDLEGLVQCVKRLLDDNSLAEQLGKNAYKTLAETWNARIAAERLLSLFDSLKKGENCYFDGGPCSKAGIIKKAYMYNSDI
jgi:glycosyltransferase involved in cell wall biosynthesis